MPLDGPLHKAANDGDVNQIRNLLDEKHEVDAPGANDRTALHRAVGGGHVAAAEILLKKGARVDAKDRQGRTPFHWAALEGQVAILKLLLQHAADSRTQLDVNAKGGESGKTALHFAVMNKKTEAIEFLCGLKETNRAIKDNEGQTPWDFYLSSHPNSNPPASLNPNFTVDPTGSFTPENTAKDTLYKLLSHQKGKAIFYNHLRKNFAEENYLLYEELLKLSELKSLEEKLERGQEIYLSFISQTGSRSTFMPEEVVNQFNQSRNANEIEAYDVAIKLVRDTCFNQLLEIFLSGFSLSPEYRAFLENPESVAEPSLPATSKLVPAGEDQNKGTVGLLFGGGDTTKFANVLGIGSTPATKGVKDVDMDSILAETQATLAELEKKNANKAPPPEDYESSDSDAYLLSDSDEDEEEEGEE